MPEDSDLLGLDLKPGDHHYRAYVGPPKDYDLIAAMTFNLVTTLGLRQHHTLLDVGCGSLRIGRLLIPYLNRGHYVGIEPNKWLVEEGVAHEIGEGLVRIKEPRFIYSDAPGDLAELRGTVDFAIAQSIFSHTGWDLTNLWLDHIARSLRPAGVLVATFVEGEIDSEESGWVYPGCVTRTETAFRDAALRVGLRPHILDWKHPRQKWMLLAGERFDTSWLENQPLSWNAMVAAHRANGSL